MEGVVAMSFHAAAFASAEADMDSLLRCERAIELALTNRGNPSAEADRVLANNPNFIFGHCLRAALIVRTDEDAARSTLAASVIAIESARLGVDHPALDHARAARAWLDGDQSLAAKRYGDILLNRPRDVLALMAAHAIDFRLGQRRQLRDRVAQVLPEWNAEIPGYASILAMYAFGLEEN